MYCHTLYHQCPNSIQLELSKEVLHDCVYKETAKLQANKTKKLKNILCTTETMKTDLLRSLQKSLECVFGNLVAQKLDLYLK